MKMPTVEEWEGDLYEDIFVCPNCQKETEIEVTWTPEEGEECNDENMEIECLACGEIFGIEYGRCTRDEVEGAINHDIWQCEKCKKRYVKWWCSNWGHMEGNLCQSCFTKKTGRIPADVTYCDKEGSDYWINERQIEEQPAILREDVREQVKAQ